MINNKMQAYIFSVVIYFTVRKNYYL